VHPLRTLASVLLALGALLALPSPAVAAAGRVDVIEVTGLIDPVEVDFIAASLRDAERARVEALIIQLNSGGAVVADRRLDDLVRRLRQATVPVAVWVGPSSARAGGGALRIAGAADVLGIAPGAHVRGAVGGGVGPVARVDAPVLGDFIVGLDGLPVGGRTLDTATVVRTARGPRLQPGGVRFSKPALLPRLLHTVASPSVAYLLFVVGLVLIVFEFFTVGVGAAGAAGAGSLILALYGLSVLPTRPLSAGLLALGVAGFAIDLQAGAPRTWTVIGTIALLAGSLRLYDGHVVPWWTVLLVVGGVALLMVAGMPAMLRARFSTPTIGRESMIGEMGAAAADVDPEGTVTVRGALWRARTNRATPIVAGDAVRVVAIDGLLLEVEPEEGGAKDAHH
jgi:membrane-bound serine protease (ClpP class)